MQQTLSFCKFLKHAKHFSNEKRTVATGIVTAAASIGYFLSPLFTKYTLGTVGWEQTLKYFL